MWMGLIHDPSILTDLLSFCKAFNNKFCFQINLSYMQGIDWSPIHVQIRTAIILSPNPNFPSLNGAAKRCFRRDGINTVMTHWPEACCFDQRPDD